MSSGSRVRARTGHPLGLTLLALLAAQACTRENVTGVTVHEISVLPPAVTVLRDESIQLVAHVRDEQGRLLETANVTWTSDRPSVVSVSPDGLVSAVGVGPATVRASLGGAEGSSSVVVTAPVVLRAEPQSVTLRGAVDADSPEPVRIDIRDEGQEVEDLEASVAYPAGSGAGWLEARLHDDESPTELELSVESSQGMAAGAYTASVLVWGRDTRESPVVIPVTMTLAGVAVLESDGRTLVSGSSGHDEVTVELLLRPERDVVLRVRSRDTDVALVSPAELRFTPTDWNVPQTLTLTAGSGEGGSWWGFQNTEVTVEVDRPLSDAAYGPVGETVVPVAVYRSPFRVDVTETSGSTVAHEEGATDTLLVSLPGPPERRLELDVSVDERKDARVHPDRVTFTSSDWSEPQRIVFSAVKDRRSDGDRTRLITLSVRGGSDDAFDDLQDMVVEGTTVDDGDGGRGGGHGGRDDEDDDEDDEDDDDDDNA